MYSAKDRQQIQDGILSLATSDSRIVAAAIVGSEAIEAHDQWSDIDLTFGVVEGTSISIVLGDWTQKMKANYQAAHLFDIGVQTTIYRVFLLPNCLQVDLSFSPAKDFGARSPKFKLLYGQSVEKPHIQKPSVQTTFGYAVHHALRARFSIERNRLWLAEYWLSSCRDYALTLACLHYNCNPFHGRGYDDLPDSVHQLFLNSLPKQLIEYELRRALSVIIKGLIAIASQIPSLEIEVQSQLERIGDLNKL